MAARRSKHDAVEGDRSAEDYREAASLALEQLQWVINYLYRINKSELAKALDRNRLQIIRDGGLAR